MNEATPIMNEPQGDAVGATRNAWAVARPGLAWPLSMAALCALLALLGAIQSYSLGLGLRFLFWGSLFAIATIFAFAIEAGLLRAGFGRASIGRWWAMLAMCLALAMTPIAYLANSLGGPAPLSMLLPHFLNSLVISVSVVGLRIGLGRFLDAEPAQDANSRPSLLDRLEPARRAASLCALEADGHYVRVHTDAGSELILMRLKDAIAETNGAAGLQVHRGWWVARDAVQRISRSDGKVELRLAGDIVVPVSRNHRATLREAGWLG